MLRGWCAYFRPGVSSATFAYLSAYTCGPGHRMAAPQTPPDHLEGTPPPLLRGRMVAQPRAKGRCSTRRRCAPRATDTGEQRSRLRGRPRHEEPHAPMTGLVESPLPGNGHAGFGRRLGETHRWKHRQGAPGRPHGSGVTCASQTTIRKAPVGHLPLRHGIQLAPTTSARPPSGAARPRPRAGPRAIAARASRRSLAVCAQADAPPRCPTRRGALAQPRPAPAEPVRPDPLRPSRLPLSPPISWSSHLWPKRGKRPTRHSPHSSGGTRYAGASGPKVTDQAQRATNPA